ncbi:MAG: hypothetical protein JNK74_21885 [Candidatus Hydrogenedentes bacterium]|nr:hypothetical protein [Candidatus Hydrogenedentota bacterium]
MLWKVCTLSFSAGFLLVAPVHADPDSAIQADSALLESLVAQNEATVRKLESSPLYAEYTWRTTKTMSPIPSPDGADLSGPMVIEGRARYWRDGASFCEDKDVRNTWTASGEVRDVSNIFMINDRYAVNYYKEFHELHLYQLDDRNNLYQAVKSKVEINPYPDILRFGTRYSTRRTLKEAYEGELGGGQADYRWTPSEIDLDGKPYYKIVVERIEGAKMLHQKEILLDPRSGFLIAESSTYNKTGDPFYIVQARFQQLADGMCFPKSASRKLTQDNEIMNIEVEKVTLGDPEIGKMITLEALDIDRESTIMYEYSNRGTQRTLKGYWGDKWVLLDLLPPEVRKAIGEAQRKANVASQHLQGLPNKENER